MIRMIIDIVPSFYIFFIISSLVYQETKPFSVNAEDVLEYPVSGNYGSGNFLEESITGTEQDYQIPSKGFLPPQTEYAFLIDYSSTVPIPPYSSKWLPPEKFYY